MVHSGQASGGHYYSYIKQRIQEESGVVDKWYRFDDVDVSECNVDQVGSSPVTSQDHTILCFLDLFPCIHVIRIER